MITLCTVLSLFVALPVQAAPPPPFGEVWDAPPDLGQVGGEPAGSASISPASFVVQTKDSVDYTYTVGAGGMAEGDFIRLEDPWGHGMRWSKWGSLQEDASACSPLAEETDEASGGLVTASTSGEATVQLERSTTRDDPHAYAYTDVYVAEGALVQGDTITLRVGDTSSDIHCGHQFPDRAFSRWQWRAFEHIGEAGFAAVTPYPEFEVVAERDAALLWVSGPSFVEAGTPFVLKVTALDRLGNPIPAWGETALLDAGYGGGSQDFGEDNPGWLDFGLRIDDPGVHRIEVTAGTFTVSSNPIVVTDGPPQQRLFWGDLHSHHGHTILFEDGTRLNENHVYARDALGHDLGCESMKMTPVELDDVNLWAELQADCQELSVDGGYLVMLGTEWMGNLDGSGDGHHNVYFDDCTGVLGDHNAMHGLGGEDGLLAMIHQLELDQGTRSVVLPHATTSTGRNWTVHDPELRRSIEVHSEWGDSIDSTAQGNVGEALAQGHRMGFIAASDNHDGWFGNPLTFKYAQSGLAAFWAPELTREDIFEALRQRRSYGTSGARMVVEFEATEGESTLLSGGEYVARQPTFAWNVHGTASIASVTLTAIQLQAGSRPELLDSDSPVSLDSQGQYTWSGWDGSSQAVWLTVTQDDGEMAWATPIWITQDCDSELAEDPEGYCLPDTGPTETDRPDDTDDSDPDSPTETGDSGPDDSDTIPGRRDPCGCVSPSSGAGGAMALLLAGLVGAVGYRRREG
jgi:MYXO-CTERM domain-containing protein